MMDLGKFSVGVGDRFGRQGRAQLRAIKQAAEAGVQVTPVWNKSHREHALIGTSPADVRAEADAAVAELGWQGAYFVDADHIGLSNVDLFVDASDFFTLDVADLIGRAADEAEVGAFVERHRARIGSLSVPGIEGALEVTEEQVTGIARKFLLAVSEAGRIYRHVAAARGEGNFVTEVSMDESDEAQSPVEMLFILAAMADEGIPAQTIAPKFTGRFNKGVDYVGDVGRFTREFEQDLAVVAYAVGEFGLASDLKLSVHSGSDKFSLYGPIADCTRRRGSGLHLKTAGTTWLEELIGLALAGGEGLAIAVDVYLQALDRYDELCGPYATVIDIDRDALPPADAVAGWSGGQYAAALRHDQACDAYNSSFRQILHVAYKVAAEMGDRFTGALERFEDVIGDNVAENIYERHLKAVFGIGR